MRHSSELPSGDFHLENIQDSGVAALHCASDVVVKRSHSSEISQVNSFAGIDSTIDPVHSWETYNEIDQKTVLADELLTASSPKRYHPAPPSFLDFDPSRKEQPYILSETQKTVETIQLPLNKTPESPLREEREHMKLDLNINVATAVPLERPSSQLGNLLSSSNQNVEDDGTVILVSNGTCRQEPILQRPDVSGNCSSTSTRNKTASRSKRHSSKTNLYIRGLPKSMSENDLVSLVPDAGAIRSVKLVVNNDGEGYGFIDFISNEAAIEAMQHIKLQNSNQYVNFAYESEKDPLNIYVTNIPECWNSENVENLKQIFAPYGKITSALVMTRRSTNACTGTGFVRYLTSEEAQRAIDGIRKAKIILPGAKRPLELKLADQQKSRDHKIESTGLESSPLPIFNQLFCENVQHRLKPTQNLQPQQHHHRDHITDDLFSSRTVTECNLFDQSNVTTYLPPGAALLSRGSADISPSSSEEPSARPQLTTSTIMSISPAIVAAAATLTVPLCQLPCLPWLQNDPSVSHSSHTTNGLIHPTLAGAATAQKAAPDNTAVAAAAPLDFHSIATAYQMAAGQPVLNYGAPVPTQPFDVFLPFLNGQINGHPLNVTNLYPFGTNQPIWPKACFFG